MDRLTKSKKTGDSHSFEMAAFHPKAEPSGVAIAKAVNSEFGRKTEVSKPDQLHRQTYTCSDWIPLVPTAKRSVTHAKTRPTACHKQREFDLDARL